MGPRPMSAARDPLAGYVRVFILAGIEPLGNRNFRQDRDSILRPFHAAVAARRLNQLRYGGALRLFPFLCLQKKSV